MRTGIVHQSVRRSLCRSELNFERKIEEVTNKDTQSIQKIITEKEFQCIPATCNALPSNSFQFGLEIRDAQGNNHLSPQNLNDAIPLFAVKLEKP